MHPQAGNAFDRLIRLWIVGERWIIGPAVRLLATIERTHPLNRRLVDLANALNLS